MAVLPTDTIQVCAIVLSGNAGPDVIALFRALAGQHKLSIEVVTSSHAETDNVLSMHVHSSFHH